LLSNPLSLGAVKFKLSIAMSKIIQEIQKGRVLVSDGAWGTFLQRKGLTAGECPEMWNIQRPEDVL